MIYRNVSELIGRTPMMELTGIKKKYNLKANLFAKVVFPQASGPSINIIPFILILH